MFMLFMKDPFDMLFTIIFLFCPSGVPRTLIEETTNGKRKKPPDTPLYEKYTS